MGTVCGILLISAIVTLIFINPSQYDVIKIIIVCSSLFIKTIEDGIHAFNYYTFYIKAKSKIEIFESNENLRIEDLLLLQADINKIRNIKFLVPNFLHSLLSKNQHLVREEMKL